MSFPLIVSRRDAVALSATLGALRNETAAMQAAGLLSVSADDLLGGAGDVVAWLDALDHAVEAGRSVVVAMPVCSAGELQHIVYTISAVLVWADELHGEARLVTMVCDAALDAWRVIEEAAGLPDRTRGAMRPRPLTTANVPVFASDAHLTLVAAV